MNQLQIPEIGLEEYKTSTYIKKKLKEWNIEFKDGYANTGIVAWVKGNQGNKKSIGLRADFDALPITEKNDTSHQSKIYNKIAKKIISIVYKTKVSTPKIIFD